ncbi:hypothetical protein HPB50_026877 [Hyalomma asiaticum]|uniref:Uncharacterized protein n=1 Tax=Hyalomma asiaticum TaxID=266040 RepID=A0ACB7TQ17_HYAAI|nr:hypothetical protein HPB50_026877 [Hyalomma asiaticum]
MVADVLEADFLVHCGLLVDVRSRRLNNSVSQATVPGNPSKEPPLSPGLPPSDQLFTRIQQKSP